MVLSPSPGIATSLLNPSNTNGFEAQAGAAQVSIARFTAISKSDELSTRTASVTIRKCSRGTPIATRAVPLNAGSSAAVRKALADRGAAIATSPSTSAIPFAASLTVAALDVLGRARQNVDHFRCEIVTIKT